VCNRGAALKEDSSMRYFFPKRQNYDTDTCSFVLAGIPCSAPSTSWLWRFGDLSRCTRVRHILNSSGTERRTVAIGQRGECLD
jgi:hypothetical protein